MSSVAHSILKHAFAEGNCLLRHPFESLGNMSVIAHALLKTLTVGREINAELRDNLSRWTDRERGEYLWRTARDKWADPILDHAGIRVRAIGKGRVDWEQSYVVALNHTSAIDAFLLPFIPGGRVVAKSEALKFPLIGKAIAYGAQVIVNRTDGTGMSSVREAMKEWMNCNVVFFVEGTRSRTGAIQPLKAGAFKLAHELNRAILPVYIGGAHGVLPKGPFLALQRNRMITMSYGDPILPLHDVDATRNATMRALQGLATFERAFR